MSQPQNSTLLLLVLSVILASSGCDVLGLRGNSGTVFGTVRNTATENGINGAVVTLGSMHTTTGRDGTYYLEGIATGHVNIVVEQRDFLQYLGSAFVKRGGDTMVDIHLEPVPCFETILSDVGMPFVKICKGDFSMGSYFNSDDEGPIHRVSLTHDFFAGKYEVTQREYEQVVGTNPSYFSGYPVRPVEQVTWYEAVQFANSMSMLEELAACYDSEGNVRGGNPYNCEGYRLPTEAEWEFAARAGTSTHYSNNENFRSSTLPYYAWYHDNSFEQSRPVGTKNPNPWGLHDVHGNVREWIFDRYHARIYVRGAVSDPVGPMIGNYRVVRSGSWANWSIDLRSSSRDYNLPEQKSNLIGFRLVRTAK